MAPTIGLALSSSTSPSHSHNDQHKWAMLIIFFVSLLAVSFPSLSKRIHYLRIPRVVFFIGKHFGTGVILSTAFCHLLQDAFESLQDTQVNKTFPKVGNYTGLIILASLLSIFLVEYISTSYVDRMQSQASAPSTPDQSPERAAVKDDDPEAPLNEDLRSTAAAATSSQDELTPLLSQPVSRPTSIGGGSSSNPTRPARPLSSCDHGYAVRRAKSFCYGSHESGRHSHNAHTHNHGVGSSDTLFDGHHRYEERGFHARGPRNVSVADEIVRQDELEAARGRSAGGAGKDTASHAGHTHGHDIDFDWDDEESEEPHVHIGEKRQVVGILVLQMGIMIHSLVIGLTLAITSGSEFTSLVTAIIFHQLFEGLSLGIRIASLPVAVADEEGSKSKLAFLKPTLAGLFAVTTPVGILLGIAGFSRGNSGDVVHMKFTQGIMSAISAGMLIYAACVEMLAADFVMDPALWRSGIGRQVLAVGSLLAGVAAMALIE